MKKKKVSKVTKAKKLVAKRISIRTSRPKASEIISGILPDWLIEKYVLDRTIKVTNLGKDWKSSVAQVSMDFHLGKKIKLFRAGTYRFVDTKRGLPPDAMEVVELEEGAPFIWNPVHLRLLPPKKF